MYEITFCRTSKYYNPNKKGCFKKEFNTLDEIIKFYLKSNNKLYCPKIRDELTKKELWIVLKKLDSQLMLSKEYIAGWSSW